MQSDFVFNLVWHIFMQVIPKRNAILPESKLMSKLKKQNETAGKDALNGCAYFILAIIVVIILLFHYCGNSGDSNLTEKEKIEKKEEEIDDKKYLSLQAVEGYVKAQLKSPKTAEFPPINEFIKHVHVIDDKTFLITSYVDSQNVFGALIRTNFICEVEIENGYSKLIDLRILE
ncbi:hypothetical protein ACR78Z_12225 [Sphingobacterium thalpophilum]|uniref:hypothetical protein n=1 Tax=Sphingobacterium thalpophilum TaxID=259 RepID=UPI003DA49321